MIVITGGEGFIGTHLFNYLHYVSGIRNIRVLGRDSINDARKLLEDLKSAETVIHLAGVNRHKSESFLFKENRYICHQLLTALRQLEIFPRLINISSIHENSETGFGRAKKENRIDFEEYYKNCPRKLITFLTPNIFGPFCKPKYNSFVATFCAQIIDNQTVDIDNDREIDLLYIDDLSRLINFHISSQAFGSLKDFQTHKVLISEVLNKLKAFEKLYMKNGIIPKLTNDFDTNLFNTFRSYIALSNFPRKQIKHNDERGFFAEIVRSYSEGQVSISTSLPQIERGNHFHTRKIERFQILSGTAIVELRKVNSNETLSFELNSENLEYIDIPIWFTHNLINKSRCENLVMLFWINEHYSQKTHDTYLLNVR